ncbi:multicopy suppressor of BFA (Brefeldin A) [Gnomoniopsis smithogilvyi]|uniref:Multicopy suppressor of BFA (Brefeldin A) n=1 Tax=Gnomoniopsis smithogilvyi TaxID=1191159 RepID=A0A9W8YQW3_9PEZI|nr:multicopy suppressor of BFA (Brefeldin A) [Gnomoniopsis smithogilvyi]
MADDAAATTAASTRPQKPDEAAFKETVAKLEKEHTQVKNQLDAVKAKIDLASPGKNPENPTQKRRAELIAQLNEIKQKQGAGKTSRNAAQDNIKRMDDQMREKKKEIKTIIDTVGFSSEAEVDAKIKDLDAQVGAGRMTLLEEKKTVEQIGKLRRSRKQLAAIGEKQKAVDELQAKIQEIKGTSKNPEANALSDKYKELQTELDGIKAEQDAAYKELNSLRDERSKLQAQQREKWDAMKKYKDEYHTNRKAFNNWEREQKQKAWERQKSERDRIEKERKLERAQKMLAEASDPAYLDEIRRGNSLLHFFDPSFVAEKTPLITRSGLEAQADRKVDDSGIKGVKILSKKANDDEYMPAAKKGKKGKKNNASAAKTSSYNCPPSVIEDCAFMGIDPPVNAEEVPAVVEKIKAKLDHWKADQANQTQKNIEKAKKEIEKIEAEEAKEKDPKKTVSGSATPNGGAAAENGDKAVDEVTDKVKETALEETKGEEVTAA